MDYSVQESMPTNLCHSNQVKQQQILNQVSILHPRPQNDAAQNILHCAIKTITCIATIGGSIDGVFSLSRQLQACHLVLRSLFIHILLTKIMYKSFRLIILQMGNSSFTLMSKITYVTEIMSNITYATFFSILANLLVLHANKSNSPH